MQARGEIYQQVGKITLWPYYLKAALRILEGGRLHRQYCKSLTMVSARGKWITRFFCILGLCTPAILVSDPVRDRYSGRVGAVVPYLEGVNTSPVNIEQREQKDLLGGLPGFLRRGNAT